jgi:transposase
MIVVGADPHKKAHTLAAVSAATGELLGEITVAAGEAGYRRLIVGGERLGAERVWAVEDCRHVSGSLERFLVERGERVVRVAPKHMAGARRSVRERGKSDAIDARAVARAALSEGIERLPTAFLDAGAMDIKLRLDHREDLVGERTRIQNRLRWHLHDLWPEFEIPRGGLDRDKWLDRLAGRLARAEQTTRVAICREQVRRLRELTRRARELERELRELIKATKPELLALVGCGTLTAAKLIAETAGAERFASEGKLARIAGIAPIPASSGTKHRHRLDRGGNRQLNCAIHRIAVTQGRCHEPARLYLLRKQAEGKQRKEALRCLKRQLVRTILRTLRTREEQRSRGLPEGTRRTSEPQNQPVLLT